MIRTENLSVGYGKTPLIEDICLRLRPGQVVTLIGPNGSGKSTILKTVIGQLAPIRGMVFLDGRAMGALSPLEIAQKLAVLMTGRVRPELMTCWDVAAMGRCPYTRRLGILSAGDREKVWEALSLVHGEELAPLPFTEISDGQRQRVMLARALCQEPEVIVLDEPTTFLDIRYKLELLAVLKEMAQERKLAVLLSLHELELAEKISDCVVCVHNGKIERIGPPEEIFTADYIKKLFDIQTDDSELFVFRGGKHLRCGRTTGTCAALAAQGAARLLLTGQIPASAALTTPKGTPAHHGPGGAMGRPRRLHRGRRGGGPGDQARPGPERGGGGHQPGPPADDRTGSVVCG